MARSNVSLPNKCDLFPPDLENSQQLLDEKFTFDFASLNKNSKKDVGLEKTFLTQVPCTDHLLQFRPPSKLGADKRNILVEDKLDPALSQLLDGWKSENDQERFNKSQQARKSSSNEMNRNANKSTDMNINSHRSQADKCKLSNTKRPKINNCSNLLSDIILDTPKNKISTCKIGAKHPANLSSNLSDMLSSMRFEEDDKLVSNSLGSSPDSGIGSCSTDSNLNFSSDDDGISMMDILDTLDIQPSVKLNDTSLDCFSDFNFETYTSEKQKVINSKEMNEKSSDFTFLNEDRIDLSSCIKSKTQDIVPLPKYEEENNIPINSIPLTPFPTNISITDCLEKTKIRVNKHQSDLCKAIAAKFEKNTLNYEKAKKIKVEMYQNMFNQRCRLSIPKSPKLLFLYNQSWDFKNKSPQTYKNI